MKAAVCYEFGQPLCVEDVEIDAPGKGEVKVRLAATGICHSDVHLVRGEWGGDLPVVAGHEAAGVVEEIGPLEGGVGGPALKPGDHVVLVFVPSCGHCEPCAEGRPALCEPGAVANTAVVLQTPVASSSNAGDAIGGIQLGCDYQMDRFVLGIQVGATGQQQVTQPRYRRRVGGVHHLVPYRRERGGRQRR